MCKFVILLCLKCFSSSRPDVLKDEIDQSDPNIVIFDERSCDYWYCNALRGEALLNATYESTCGDQLCSQELCSANVVSWTCCWEQFKRIPYRRLVVPEVPRRWTYTITPYLIPVLSNRELLQRLVQNIHEVDCVIETFFEKLIIVENYDMYFSTYFAWNGKFKSTRYQVRVERHPYDAHPQLYDGALTNFLTLRKLCIERGRDLIAVSGKRDSAGATVVDVTSINQAIDFGKNEEVLPGAAPKPFWLWSSRTSEAQLPEVRRGPDRAETSGSSDLRPHQRAQVGPGRRRLRNAERRRRKYSVVSSGRPDP